MLTADPDDLRELLGPLFEGPLPEGIELQRRNIAPTDPILVLHSTQAGPRLAFMRWGMIPAGIADPKDAGSTFNARIETVRERRTFREAVQDRRCLVLVSGFYEWSGGEPVPGAKKAPKRKPNLIAPRQGKLFTMAGLHSTWVSKDGEIIDNCTVLTRDAEGDIATLHDRMPVFVPERLWAAWLGAESSRVPTMLKELQAQPPPNVDITPLERIDVPAPPESAPAQLRLFG